ncbi:Cellulose synthase [Macleaya cordata]|uniref:Cellulose synthase n=1 Tax=Macleaya cordata TaxID=56857 RepID=A0A200Q312_MACCD|nr:Cellulose synthase [Macleaya cordata]
MKKMTSSTADHRRLFITRQAGGRFLYKIYFIIFVAGIASLFYYRLTHIHSDHPLLWLIISLAEFWFAATWLFQQGFRWAPTFHVEYPERLPKDDLPAVDVLVCTADPDREPPSLVANTLLSLMAYNYDANKLAYYLSDDGGSELTFHAVYQASIFAKIWLPFCKKYNVEPRAPQVYFSSENSASGGVGQSFRQEYDTVKVKFEEMQERIEKAGRLRKVTNETRKEHKGFKEWDSKVDPRNHQSIVEVLLRGNGVDKDSEGNTMPTLVYVSREKRPGQPHHFKAGALNAMNRVSAVISNAPLVLNVDCDMHSNNSQALRHAVCYFLDPKESHRIGYVQFPQSFGGVTENDLYANGVKRIYEIEFFGTNAHNGPMYAGTGSVHRRESLNGRKYDPRVQLKLEDKSVPGSKNWAEFEVKAKTVTSCTYEKGKPWGDEMGLMYGSAVEDVFTGLVLQSRGWQSVFCSPERKAFLGLAPVNTNDTLIQHKRWSTGLLEIFLSDYCPWTNGVGKLKLGQIMCYSFYTLWALWCLPMLIYAIVTPLAMVNGISLFPKGSDPWFRVFTFLGIASHIFSLGELMWARGTFKMWWNETRMWMLKGSSSYLFSVMVTILKALGISESGFEITSKVIDEEALKRYKKEMMEFAVASPMFIPPTTLSLLNLYCLFKTVITIANVGLSSLDHLVLQIIISGYISIISIPIYKAMFLRKDKGRMPTSVTIYSILICLALLYLSSIFM